MLREKVLFPFISAMNTPFPLYYAMLGKLVLLPFVLAINYPFPSFCIIYSVCICVYMPARLQCSYSYYLSSYCLSSYSLSSYSLSSYSLSSGRSIFTVLARISPLLLNMLIPLQKLHNFFKFIHKKCKQSSINY